MAKRMGFSVYGLPHYTIWHLYEPSIDDIRHMEEMETERRQKEAEDKEKADRQDRINDQFESPDQQWEKDKAGMQEIAKQSDKEQTEDDQKSEGDNA